VALVIVLLVLALIVGGIGLFITGLKWLLIVALVLLAISLISGASGRRSRVR
jgi:hypothetical protein